MTTQKQLKKIYITPFKPEEQSIVEAAYRQQDHRKPDFWKKVIVAGAKAVMEARNDSDTY